MRLRTAFGARSRPRLEEMASWFIIAQGHNNAGRGAPAGPEGGGVPATRRRVFRSGPASRLRMAALSIITRIKPKGPPDYKPVSVPRYKTGRQPFLLAGNLFPAPATYPEVLTERAAPAPLFGLAPHGVCPAGVRYRSRGALLPHLFTLTRRG